MLVQRCPSSALAIRLSSSVSIVGISNITTTSIAILIRAGSAGPCPPHQSRPRPCRVACRRQVALRQRQAARSRRRPATCRHPPQRQVVPRHRRLQRRNERRDHNPIQTRIMNPASRADGKSAPSAGFLQPRARRHASSEQIPEKFRFSHEFTPSKRETRMSQINSRDRNVRIVAATATVLFALSIGATAQARHGGPGATAHPTPPVKSSYDPSKSVVRDHRTPAGSGASAIPAGTPRK
jgi:hypothetical protein